MLSRAGALLALLLLAPRPAGATWSVVAVDPTTREVGAAAATCTLGVSMILALVPDRGVVVAQAWSNPWARDQAAALLAEGAPPADAVARTGAIVDEDGPWWGSAWADQQVAAAALDEDPATAVHTGDETVPWSGARRGRRAAAQGNMLRGPAVVEAALAGFESDAPRDGCAPDLAERLLRGLEAGARAGGDARCPPERPSLNAFLAVARPGDDPAAPALLLHAPREYGMARAFWNLLVPARPDPGAPPVVALLRQRYEAWRAERATPGCDRR